MSTLSHLNALAERHEQLEKQITQELQHPSYDELKVRELKRRKLELKDEIARLEDEPRH